MKTDLNDIINKKFYWLTVKSYSHLEHDEFKRCNIHYYNCVCDCGSKLLVSRYDLLHKNKRICDLQCKCRLDK